MSRTRNIILVNIAVSVVSAVLVSWCFHAWWYKNIVDELQRACDPYTKELGIARAADPKTIDAVLVPYMKVLQAFGDFGRVRPTMPSNDEDDAPPKG